MNHILVGALSAFLPSLLLYLVRGGRASMRQLLLTPLAMGAFAVWSVVPDIPRAIGLHGLYMRMAQSPWSNLFFGHYSIDLIEGYSVFWNAAFALMLIALLTAAYRELSRTESQPSNSLPFSKSL